MKYVLVVALEEELEGLKGNYNVIYTGVGKVNAAITLTKYLENP